LNYKEGKKKCQPLWTYENQSLSCLAVYVGETRMGGKLTILAIQ